MQLENSSDARNGPLTPGIVLAAPVFVLRARVRLRHPWAILGDMNAKEGDVNPDIYRRLQNRIDELPVPYPQTESGVELRLLRALFTEQEARVAVHLSGIAEPAEVVYRRIQKEARDGGAAPSGPQPEARPQSEPQSAPQPEPRLEPQPEPQAPQNTATLSLPQLRSILNDLAAKGAINTGATRKNGVQVRTYGLAPLVVGMYEFQVDKLTPAFIQDFQEYLDEGFREAFIGNHTAQLRTVPIRQALPDQRAVGSYDDIRSYVRRSSGPFAVRNCVCRQSAELMGRPCTTSSTHETCLTVGPSAHRTVESGFGRYITREETLAIMDRAEEEGHVLQPQNAREPSFICCCCRDCCEILINARKLPRPADAVAATHQASVDVNDCIGCGICVKRCPMEAITLAEREDARGRAVVDTDRCIGCGLCVVKCPTNAITLVRRPGAVVPPRTPTGMYLRMINERFGAMGVLRTGVKKLLGRKI